MACILIVDDEYNIRSGLSLAFEDEGYDTLTCENGQKAWDIINKNSIDLVITDLRMPVLSGSELVRRISSTYPTLPVIVLTGHGTIEDAVSSMQHGALDFLTKPVNLDYLLVTVKKILKNRQLIEQNKVLTKEIETLKAKVDTKKRIIGSSSKLNKLMDEINQVANAKITVLITGESGVGKELVADAIHNLSGRKNGPFIKVNCASLAPTLLESELFGHEKGAFTGAIGQKRGRFELSNGGTLFLDEIGEIDLQTQVKILRVLQEQKFERVGGEETISVDVRVVAATNKNLEEEVKKGNFREDLFYRLNGIHIQVPPLRERKEDIPLLMAAFLDDANLENNRKVKGFTSLAKRALISYSWPGNIRQLKNTIESSVVLCKDDYVDLDDLPYEIAATKSESEVLIKVGLSLEEAERIFIMNTLDYCEGNKSKASEMLNIGRKTLHTKLEKYKLDN